MSNSLQLTLCDTQGQLFEFAAERGYSSESFIKAFMTSSISADMDKEFHHVQWAGKAYILSRMEDELAAQLSMDCEIYDKETLYWTGYIYRYWSFYTGESSREIYKQAPAKTMKTVYLMYHTMSPEMAIDRLKETHTFKKIKDAEDTIQKINALLSDSNSFRHQADSLYDKIARDMDYAPFIASAKVASGMCGNIPFKQLPYLPKRNAFIMIRSAIEAFIASKITEKK